MKNVKNAVLYQTAIWVGKMMVFLIKGLDTHFSSVIIPWDNSINANYLSISSLIIKKLKCIGSLIIYNKTSCKKMKRIYECFFHYFQIEPQQDFSGFFPETKLQRSVRMWIYTHIYKNVCLPVYFHKKERGKSEELYY